MTQIMENHISAFNSAPSLKNSQTISPQIDLISDLLLPISGGMQRLGLTVGTFHRHHYLSEGQVLVWERTPRGIAASPKQAFGSKLKPVSWAMSDDAQLFELEFCDELLGQKLLERHGQKVFEDQRDLAESGLRLLTANQVHGVSISAAAGLTELARAKGSPIKFLFEKTKDGKTELSNRSRMGVVGHITNWAYTDGRLQPKVSCIVCR